MFRAFPASVAILISQKTLVSIFATSFSIQTPTDYIF